MISSVTVAFVLMIGVSVFAFYQRNEAEKAQKRAEKTARVSKSQALAAFALIEQEKDSELSLLLATEAVRTTYDASETVLPLSNTVLRQSIIKSRVRLALTGHEGVVHSAAYSADGQRIVTGSDDKTAKVWDANTGQELLTLTGHES